jgi:hypothetical protein
MSDWKYVESEFDTLRPGDVLALKSDRRRFFVIANYASVGVVGVWQSGKIQLIAHAEDFWQLKEF